MWLIVVLFATMKLNGLNETSQKVYGIVFVGIASFIIGGLIGLKIKFVLRKKKIAFHYVYATKHLYEKKFRLNMKVIWTFTIITLIVLLIQFTAVIPLYLQGASMHDVRVIYSSGNNALNSSNVVLSIINSYVAKPFAFAIMPLSAIALFQEEKKNWRLFISGIVIVILQVIIDAGRMGVVQWLFCVVFIYLFSSQNKFNGRISSKVKLRIIILSIICFVVLVYLSSLREIENTISSFYTYICGCLPYMDARLQTVDNSRVLTYGASAIFGLITIISWLLSIVGIYPAFFTTVTKMASVQEKYFIGAKIEFNAFVTTFYHFYIDGRWIGVIIGMLIYGYLCGRCYKHMTRNTNSKTIYIYTLILVGLLFSMVRFPFVKTNYVLALCYTPLFFKKYISNGGSV